MAHFEPNMNYPPKTTNPVAKDLTVFVGLAVNGVLNITVLEAAAHDLVYHWPILGGTLIRTVSLCIVLVHCIEISRICSQISRRAPTQFEAVAQLISNLELSTNHFITTST
jgi:hypothetical protein